MGEKPSSDDFELERISHGKDATNTESQTNVRTAIQAKKCHRC